LTTDQAAELTKDVHWLQLAGWDWNVDKDASCPDAGGVSLTRSKINAGCSCGCDVGAPKGLEEALSNAYQWVERLITEGKPLTGAVTALAYPGAVSGDTNVPTVSWPLARTMSSIPGLIYEQSNPPSWQVPLELARFDDPAEAAKLREARVASQTRPANGGLSNYIPVEEGSMEYRLYVRDELPEAAAKAWTALEGSVPAP
jgi:hypothetical protein